MKSIWCFPFSAFFFFLSHFTACSHNENLRKKEHLWSSANYWEIWERTFLEWTAFRSSSKHLCPQWCCSFHLPALCCCVVPAGPCQVRLISIKELSCKEQQNMAARLLRVQVRLLVRYWWECLIWKQIWKKVKAGCTVIFPKALFDFSCEICTLHLFLVA